MQPLVYARFGNWNADNNRTFMMTLPRPVANGTPLLAETGERIGKVIKTWPPVEGRTSVRIRVEPRFIDEALALRPDLAAYRRTIGVDPDGCLHVAGRIDTKQIRAAAEHVQRAPSWHGPARIVP